QDVTGSTYFNIIPGTPPTSATVTVTLPDTTIIPTTTLPPQTAATTTKSPLPLGIALGALAVMSYMKKRD
ncbi:MAG: hypothetical protein LUQ35_07480, partial [Methanoregula sp.]|nr:hypothetical protein [Methanoregula sp.]